MSALKVRKKVIIRINKTARRKNFLRYILKPMIFLMLFFSRHFERKFFAQIALSRQTTGKNWIIGTGEQNFCLTQKLRLFSLKIPIIIAGYFMVNSSFSEQRRTFSNNP